MKKMAMVKNGVVENIAIWDGVSKWEPVGFSMIDVTNITCDIGWSYSNGVFSAPFV